MRIGPPLINNGPNPTNNANLLLVLLHQHAEGAKKEEGRIIDEGALHLHLIHLPLLIHPVDLEERKERNLSGTKGDVFGQNVLGVGLKSSKKGVKQLPS